MNVIDKIEKVETINLGGHADVPGEAIIITKASIKE
jgi:cyclophilin family peptidyl-prolyl cis-trans isomerase